MKDLKKENLFRLPQAKLEEITSADFFPKALNYMVMIIFPQFKGEVIGDVRTKGGLVLPDESLSRLKLGLNVGRIVSIGKTVGAGKAGALEEAKTYTVGDWIHFRPHTGYPIYHLNEMFYVIKDEDITVKIHNYETITDEIFNNYALEDNQ